MQSNAVVVRLEVSSTLKILVAVFCVVTMCSNVAVYMILRIFHFQGEVNGTRR